MESNTLLRQVCWGLSAYLAMFEPGFRSDGRELELAAGQKGRIVGGLVAVWTDETEMS